jgi:hypothetical protein
MGRRGDDDLALLRQALLEQKQNETAWGRTPSSLAANAYLGQVPFTNEQAREATTLSAMDERLAAQRAADDVLGAKEKARLFANRTGVEEIGGGGTRAMTVEPPLAFTRENFPPMASHAPTTQTVRNIQRIAPVTPAPPSREDVTTAFGTSPQTRNIRRFGSNTTPTDPDAAMGLKERARLAPAVLAADINAEADVAVADRMSAGMAGKTRPVTGAERQSLSYFNRGQDALKTISAPDTSGASLEDRVAKSGLANQVGLQYAPNIMQTGEQQQYRQAQRAFTEARLRKESGAAIPTAEYENDAATYFAQPGDAPALIDQKRKARNVVLSGMKFASGRAYNEFYGDDDSGPRAAGAGRKVGRFEIVSEQ